MEPFHESFDLQRGAAWYKQTARFDQHHCLRQLALIEFPERRLEYVPLSHAALVQDILERREQETCECRLWSEDRKAAARRLVEYSRDDARGYANARFLELTVENTDGRIKPVMNEAAAQVATSGSGRSSGGSSSCCCSDREELWQ